MLWSSLPLMLFSSKTMIAGADVVGPAVHFFIIVSAAFVANVIAVVVVTAVAVVVVVVVVFVFTLSEKELCKKSCNEELFICHAKSDPRDLGVPKLFNQMQRISFNDYA